MMKIFNADECALFYKALPDSSLVEQGNQCKKGKESKDRINVLLCASVTGEKFKPLVISNSKSNFKQWKPLPVRYASNQTAWMTSEIFESWINADNDEMTKQKRRILL